MKEKKSFWAVAMICIGAASVAVILAVVGTTGIPEPVRRAPANPLVAAQASSGFRTTVDRYLISKLKHPDVWWQEDSAGVRQQPEAVATLHAKLEKKKGELLELLARYRSVSPLAEKVAKRFDTLTITIMEPTGISMTVAGPNQLVPDLSKSTEVCFMPKNAFLDSMPSNLYWDKEWSAVKIAALDWPEKFLPGILFHELGHGLCQFEPGAVVLVSATAEDRYTEEEILMHELELVVIDSACGGAYVKMLDRIITKHSAQNWSDLFQKVTLSDLQDLDRVLGAERSGERVSQAIIAQDYVALGLRIIERGKLSLSEKLAMYRWLRKNV